MCTRIDRQKIDRKVECSVGEINDFCGQFGEQAGHALQRVGGETARETAPLVQVPH